MPVPKKKVTFILPTFTAGGAERILITLMNGLDRARFSPEFIVLHETGPLRALIAPGIPIHSLGHQKVRNCMPKLAKKLNQIEPDIAVSTMAAMNFALLLTKPLLKSKPRIIVREAVVPSSIIDAQKMPMMVKTAYKTLYPHADLVISPAQCIIDEFESLGLRKLKHVLLHNPVDAARIRAGELPRRKNPGIVQFVAAGRLHKQKGFDRLIETLPDLHTDWKLTIFGEGAEREVLQNLIRINKLEKRITLAGLISNPWPHYAAADVFLLPSRWEGLPNVALESLCAGTPVVAMKEAGGIGEIAALATPGAVTLADDIKGFITALEKIKPAAPDSFRPSLLPAQFNLETVNRKFAELLV